MSGIFISYRRNDSAPYAGRLHDRLCDYFGTDKVFMDVDDIKPGADFVSLIEQKVASCDALIAVIGKTWLMRDEESGRSRLDHLEDFVRLEIEHALRRNILLIPALVEGAEMPRAEDLPAPLNEFSQRQAVELSDKDFQRGVDKVIAALEKFPALRNRSQKDETHQKTTQPSTGRRPLSWGAPIAVLIVMLFLAWQWNAGKKSEPIHSAKAIAGVWEANATYSWGDSYKEEFRFKTEENRLFGTASFLRVARNIEEGKVDGDKISFGVRFQEMSGAATSDHKNFYTGKLTGTEIQFRIQDDRGNPPVEFTARKTE
jgi:hypothetical protein